MKLKFIGVPGEAHATINMYGVTFPLGEVVTLDEADPKNATALRKLARHPHFAVVTEDAPAPKVAAVLKPAAKSAKAR